ncbi:MAG TPA: APC family permease [Vicinamibacteria bacterium]|nr:APC family permease [Vicinamibacteria bacterium]
MVATSVMLSFISFWRAAAIVLADLGSSAFYAGGIAEEAVGRAAPWFILGVMLFSYAVRAVYIESCTMFTRGGVYRVVKEAMGGTLAKLSVSALMFDYVLTGPISAVSAGQYIVGLVAQVVTYLGHPWSPSKASINHYAAVLAAAVIVYFWWRNIQGIHESSQDALRIMWVATPMVVLMIAWGLLTVATRPAAQRLPPAPTTAHLSLNTDAVGWAPKLLPGSFARRTGDLPGSGEPASSLSHWGLVAGAGKLVGLIGILIALGHSILAMSGEETLAQVNRELEHPKHRNLMRAGFVIFVYSLVFTSSVSFLAYALIPDTARSRYFDNLISGIAMNLLGPPWLRLAFQAYVVLVGFLLLAGAVNTAIIGSNAVLNRVSEDGVLTPWLRQPHPRFGTTHRIINLIVLLQLGTIVGSRGNVYVLGEAYAFGVVWSFAFKALAVLVLRYKDRSAREWRVPCNLDLRGNQLPIGLGAIAALLFTIAGVNLVTKQVATVSGLAFTLLLFGLFSLSERARQRRLSGSAHVEVDQFRLQPQETISTETVRVRPAGVLCPVRDYTNLDHVRRALQLTDTARKDLVVMTVHPLRGPDPGYRELSEHRLFTDYEQLLFSRVVSLAEREGKHVELMVVPSSQPFEAIVHTASQLYSDEIISGPSARLGAREQALRFGEAWEGLPHKPRHQVRLRIVEPSGKIREFLLGAHPPKLAEVDVHLIHELWLDLKQALPGESVRHRDIVTAAVQRLARELAGRQRTEVIDAVESLKRAERARKPGRRESEPMVVEARRED